MSPRDISRLAPARVLLAAFACAALAALASVLLLALSGWFLTAAALAGAGGAAAAAAFNYLIPSAAIRALAILRTGTRYGERLLSHRAALSATAVLRGRLFARLAAQDSRAAPDFAAGDASARLIGDIEALEDLIVRRPTRPAGIAAALLAIGLVALAGWKAALALGVLLALLPIWLAAAAARLTRVPAAEAADALGALRTAFVDFAAARPEIIAYGLADRVTAEVDAIAARADRARAALFRGEGAIAGLLAAYAAVAAAAMLALSDGAAPLTALAMLAAASAVEAMAAFARTALREASVRESLLRLGAFAALEGEPQPPPAREAARPIRIGAHVLAPGERVAITGPSGSGKTRLLEALAGLRAPVHDLAIGDAPVGTAPPQALAGQIALAPQDPSLIIGTIADNLRLARPGVDAAAMAEALAIARLDPGSCADGLETLLGEGGSPLSGGERKRLSLARALLARRPWLLLDEPTEGLDAGTEADVVAALRGWLDATGTGLLLVSHRPAPLALAMRTIAIDAI